MVRSKRLENQFYMGATEMLKMYGTRYDSYQKDGQEIKVPFTHDNLMALLKLVVGRKLSYFKVYRIKGTSKLFLGRIEEDDNVIYDDNVNLFGIRQLQKALNTKGLTKVEEYLYKLYKEIAKEYEPRKTSHRKKHPNSDKVYWDLLEEVPNNKNTGAFVSSREARGIVNFIDNISVGHFTYIPDVDGSPLKWRDPFLGGNRLEDMIFDRLSNVRNVRFEEAIITQPNANGQQKVYGRWGLTYKDIETGNRDSKGTIEFTAFSEGEGETLRIISAGIFKLPKEGIYPDFKKSMMK